MAEQRPTQSHQTTGKEPQLEANFLSLVQTFAVQAMLCTGDLRNPDDEKAAPNLEHAKYPIAMLELLAEKTKGNLTADEQNFLDEMLHVVRMAFVRATDRLAQPPPPEKPVEEAKEGG